MRFQVKRVSGAQADGAKQLGLVKIAESSARDLFNMGVPIILAPSKAAPWHFFKGWGLAMTISNDGDSSFDVIRNRFNANADSELGNAAWFVEKEHVVGPLRSSRNRR